MDDGLEWPHKHKMFFLVLHINHIYNIMRKLRKSIVCNTFCNLMLRMVDNKELAVCAEPKNLRQLKLKHNQSLSYHHLSSIFKRWVSLVNKKYIILFRYEFLWKDTMSTKEAQERKLCLPMNSSQQMHNFAGCNVAFIDVKEII